MKNTLEGAAKKAGDAAIRKLRKEMKLKTATPSDLSVVGFSRDLGVPAENSDIRPIGRPKKRKTVKSLADIPAISTESESVLK